MTWVTIGFVGLIIFMVVKKKMMMSGMPQITAQSLNEKLANKESVVVLDVRESYEYRSGAIANSKHIPLGDFLKNGIASVSKEQTIVCVCASGMRSSMAVNYLIKNGFQNVFNLKGGMYSWESAGFPVK